MAWSRLDDDSTFHPKVLAAGNAAWGALMRLVSWSNHFLTDGLVPEEMVRAIAATDEIARLLTVGFLESAPTGYQIHDFHDYSCSAAEVLARRAELSATRSAAGMKGANSRWNGNGHGKPDGKDSKTDGKRNGKTMANGWQEPWQRPWQMDGPIPIPRSDPDPEETSPPARVKAPGPDTQPPSAPRASLVKLRAAWSRASGNLHASSQDLQTLADCVSTAAAEQSPPVDPNVYAEQIVVAFVAWIDGIREGKRPQKSPLKLLEHFARAQEIADGKRLARPPPDVPTDARGRPEQRARELPDVRDVLREFFPPEGG